MLPSDTAHPLHPLAVVPQWVNWHLVNRPGEPKPAKVPFDPSHGHAIDPHDSSNWMSFDKAHTLGSIHECGVGFVFTADQPHWFLDLDNCLTDDGQWSPLANDLCSLFRGAAVEVSQSGRGIHIFGTGTVPPGYRSRNRAIGLEFYTDKRFAAINLAGPHAGNAAHDCTTALAQFVPQYLTAADDAAEDAPDWTNAPREDWSGPTDDDDLITRMLGSRSSAGALFGGKATVQQLWTADAPALAAAYPANSGDPEEYGASEADAALMQHLAFWTGCDCERMDRLFRRSALMRDKYEKREDYRKRTILGATRRCKSVYSGSATERVRVTDDTEAPNASELPASSVMTVDEQDRYFTGCHYIIGRHEVFTPRGQFLKPDAFSASYGGYHFVADEDGKTTKSAFEVFTQSRVRRRKKVDNVCFRPEMKPGSVIEHNGMSLLNTYIPAQVAFTKGDASRFTNHVAKLLPDRRDREILLSYMAACVQHAGRKFQFATVVQGVEGNGKTLLATCVSYAVGEQYTHFPNASDLGGNGAKFNAWLENKLFIGIEEIRTADKREVTDAMKTLITNARIEIQAKGGNQYTGDNRANFMLFSNHHDAVAKTENDRRYAVFYTAQQEHAHLERDGMSGSYFPDLYDWLRAGGYGIVAEYLRTYPIPDELNPAGVCHRAPETTATRQAIEESRGAVEQEVIEATKVGRSGMMNGWISSIALDKLLGDARMGNRMPRNKRKDMLKNLGYEPHPHLPGGRVTTVIMQEQGRPILYVRTGSLQAQLTEPAAVIDRYVRDQGWSDAMSAVGA